MNKVRINMLQNCYGKETIDTNTYGKSSGHGGNYSTNYQQTGRELLTADEVRMLDNDKAILLIRGEKPVVDMKYDILKHPKVKYTVDGNAKEYEYGKTNNATGTIFLLSKEEIENLKNTKELEEVENTTYELLSEEEIENYVLEEEYQKLIIKLKI